MLTNAQVEEFLENGFLVVKGLIEQGKLDELIAALDRVVKKVNEKPESFETRYTQKQDGKWDTWGVSDLFCPELYEEKLGEFLAEGPLLSAVQSILGPELRFWGANSLWNPSEVNYYLPWHRDGGDQKAHDPSGRLTHVQFNATLMEDACFRAIPGSHRRLLTDEEMHEVITLGTASLPGETIVHCEPGDVLFMNAWTLHRGECSTDKPRRTLHINLQPKHETYGGHTTRSWMQDPNNLKRIHPTVRQLIQNLMDWDANNPVTPKSRTAIKHIYLLSQPVEKFKEIKL